MFEVCIIHDIHAAKKIVCQASTKQRVNNHETINKLDFYIKATHPDVMWKLFLCRRVVKYKSKELRCHNEVWI